MGCGASSEEDRKASAIEDKRRQRRKAREEAAAKGDPAPDSSVSESATPSNSKYKKRESQHWAPVTVGSPKHGEAEAVDQSPGPPQGAWSPVDESLGSSELYSALMRPSGKTDVASPAREDEGDRFPAGAAGAPVLPPNVPAQDDDAAADDGSDDNLIPTQE
jgi:hypothetical protein